MNLHEFISAFNDMARGAGWLLRATSTCDDAAVFVNCLVGDKPTWLCTETEFGFIVDDAATAFSRGDTDVSPLTFAGWLFAARRDIVRFRRFEGEDNNV